MPSRHLVIDVSIAIDAKSRAPRSARVYCIACSRAFLAGISSVMVGCSRDGSVAAESSSFHKFD